MAQIALFPTCLVDVLGADVGAAVVRTLRRCGYEVTLTRDATCCGQPAWNAGFADEAAKVARTTLEALEGHDLVCVPAGSCATMMRTFWPELFHVTGDEDARRRAERAGDRVREFSELVADEDHAGRAPRKVAYHHSCHMLRELGIADEPEGILRSLGAEIVDWPAAKDCCGFGGLFSVKQPETSVAMADDKIDRLADTGAEALVGCDQSCLMHLTGRMRRRGIDLPVHHLAQILDEAALDEAPDDG